MYRPALLFVGESGKPDWYQAILAVGQAQARVRRDFQEKMTVATSVDELVFGRLTYRKPAKNERPGVVRDLLSAGVPLLTDKLYYLQPL
jgi:hypothetical protein